MLQKREISTRMLDHLAPMQTLPITSLWGLSDVVSVAVLDKVLWSGLLGPVIQLTYIFEHEVVIALTSDIREACLSAVERKLPSPERLKGVAPKHHLVDGIGVHPALLTGNVVEHYRHHYM